MKASMASNLSPGLTRWAVLLAVAVLPFAAGCIAETGTPDGQGHGEKTGPNAPAAQGGTRGTGTPSVGGVSPPPQTAPAAPGPVFGPIPSPWQPPSDDNSQQGMGDLGSTGMGSSPVPSPWTGGGPSMTGSGAGTDQQPGQSQSAPPGKTN